MNENRYKLLWIDRITMIDLMFGAVRVTNLPFDCRIEAMTFDFSRESIGLRLRSKYFPVHVFDGRETELFAAEFEPVPKSTPNMLVGFAWGEVQSKYLSGDIVSLPNGTLQQILPSDPQESEQTKTGCTCPMDKLMMAGCDCGSINRD